MNTRLLPVGSSRKGSRPVYGTRNDKAFTLTKAQPPPPDTNKIPRYKDKIFVECIYSDDLKYRAVLLRDNSANLHIRCEMWDLAEWEDGSGAFWVQVTQGTTITDTIGNARSLARERLLALGAQTKGLGISNSQ